MRLDLRPSSKTLAEVEVELQGYAQRQVPHIAELTCFLSFYPPSSSFTVVFLFASTQEQRAAAAAESKQASEQQQQQASTATPMDVDSAAPLAPSVSVVSWWSHVAHVQMNLAVARRFNCFFVSPIQMGLTLNAHTL